LNGEGSRSVVLDVNYVDPFGISICVGATNDLHTVAN
jgi:hypothetical protein